VRSEEPSYRGLSEGRHRAKSIEYRVEVKIQLFFRTDSAMHHVGYMAALNPDGFRAKALDLTWFRANSAFRTFFIPFYNPEIFC